MVVRSLVMEERKHTMDRPVMSSKSLEWKLAGHLWGRCETNWYLLLLRMWCLNHLLLLTYDRDQWKELVPICLWIRCWHHTAMNHRRWHRTATRTDRLLLLCLQLNTGAGTVLLRDKELDETWEQSLRAGFSWKGGVMSRRDYGPGLSQGLAPPNSI